MRLVGLAAFFMFCLSLCLSTAGSMITQEKIDQMKVIIDQGKSPITREYVISFLGAPLKSQIFMRVYYLLYETEVGEFYLFLIDERTPDIGYKKVDPADPQLTNLFNMKVDADGIPLDSGGRSIFAESPSAKTASKNMQQVNKQTEINLKKAEEYFSRGQMQIDWTKALEWYDKAIQLNPNHSMALQYRGSFHYRTGNYQAAFHDFDRALALTPDPRLYNQVAWLLATCPDAQGRDGMKAIQYAEKALSLEETATGVRENLKAAFLHTLAAAYAEAGDFGRAVEMETQAFSLYQAYNPDEQKRKDEFRQLIDVYKSKKSFVQWSADKRNRR